MALLVRSVVRRGAASGGLPLAMPAQANGEALCRSMSTSWIAKSAGSLLGRHSVKIEGGAQEQKVGQAMDAIERRERNLRIPETRERHRYHEKGYDKTRKQKKRKKWREEYRSATRQLNWMSLLKEKGVPIPGQRTGQP